MEYGPVTDDGVRENVNARIDDAFFSYPDILSYSDIVVNLREVSDHSLFPNGHKVTDPDLLSEFCTPGYTAAATVAFVAFLLGIDIVQQLREGSVGAFHAHQGRSDRCTRLEILVYKEDGSLAGIDVMFVFRICEEAKLPRFSMFNLCKSRCTGLWITVHSAVQDFSQFLCA